MQHKKGVDGFIVDEYVKQVKVDNGLTPSGDPATQPAVDGYLTNQPHPHLTGLEKPELMKLYFGGHIKNPKPPMPLRNVPKPKPVKKRNNKNRKR